MSFLKKYLKWISTLLVLTGILLTNLNIYPLNIYFHGLGVVGWGVGGIEAESVMLGQVISMVLPEVVGFRLTNKLDAICTATDLVLTCVEMLRKRGVVGKFVEFFGPGCESLSLTDRATIANMSPEYGATMGYFPVDAKTIDYLRMIGADEDRITMIE